MKLLNALMIITGIYLSSISFVHAEPGNDRLLGKVNLGSKTKPDAKGRREIASIAAKINKVKGSGSVKLRGDFPEAENAEDYLLKTVFMARDVEQLIKPLLSKRFQTFVMTSKYSGEKRTPPNIVEIFFYPQELRVEEMEALRHITKKQNELPKEIYVPEDKVQEAVQQGYEAVYDGKEPDSRAKDSKKLKVHQESEDPSLANELVNRAKARAAEKAKRDARESATPQ